MITQREQRRKGGEGFTPESCRARPYYETELTLTTSFRVVPESDAERVVLVSSASLDQRINAGLEIQLEPGHTAHWSTGDGDYFEQQGCSILKIYDLPENVAWKVSFRDEYGVIDPNARFGDVVGRAGPVFFAGLPHPVDIGTAGHFRGTLILTPDPAAAYPDPRIKTIWNRTLEIPVDSTIRTGVSPWRRENTAPVDPVADFDLSPQPGLSIGGATCRCQRTDNTTDFTDGHR